MHIFYLLTGTKVAEAGTLFTLPDASTTLANVGAYSSPLFSDFLPLIYIILGVLVIAFLISIIIGAFTKHH